MTTTMAEVLAEHRLDTVLYLISQEEYRCICGKRSGSHEDHQAAALSAAGFGLVADAGAKALEDAADALKEARGYIDPWGKPTYQNYADWLRARAAAVRGEG